jgi:hypothetical protein
MKLSDHAVATSATPAAATFCPWLSGGLAQAAVETNKSTHATQVRTCHRRATGMPGPNYAIRRRERRRSDVRKAQVLA